MKNTLNKIVLEEAIDEALYRKEAELFRDKIVDGDRIAKIFEQFAKEEKVHCEVVKEIFDENWETIKIPKPVKLKESLRETLYYHVEKERETIRMYEGILKQSISPLNTLMIKGILFEENNHLNTAIHYLKRIKE